MEKHPPRPTTKPRLTAQGAALTRQRLKYGLRQSDVAKVLDCHPGRISEWEQGIRSIPADVLLKLKELFRELEQMAEQIQSKNDKI